MTLISVAAMTSATMPTSNSLIPNGPSATAQAGRRRRGRSARVTLLTASRYANPAPERDAGPSRAERPRDIGSA
jgi:hypothetical protein